MSNQPKMIAEKTKVIFFTNIISPYRIFLFNKLEEIGRQNQFDFEVYFMRETESNRNWEVDKDSIKFNYNVGNGLYFRIKSYFGHFNPVLIFNLLKSRDEIILGASWNNLNVLLIALLKSLGLLKNKLSVWSEANYLTNESQQKSKLRDFLKKWFFAQIDGNFVVPGKMATVSFDNWGIPYKNLVYLPNLVNNNVFERKLLYKNDRSELPVFFIVARLEESIKGISNFLTAIGNDNIKKVKFRIAGTGSSLSQYQYFVKENHLENNVAFLGNLSESEVSTEYTNANVFVLPSFSDPSPLTIIEALYSGLPVLISNRCGNHFETVQSGENGYIFNPMDHKDVKDKFEKLLENRNQWEKYSSTSIKIAHKNYDPDAKLLDFVQSY